MCDYSLMGVPNRLAKEGEDLVVFRFPTGSRGLTPCEERPNNLAEQRRPHLFQSIVQLFFGNPKDNKVAVCIPPGARLLLGDIPNELQDSLKVAATEEVTFTQLTAKPRAYRDAVRFKNGRELLLQQLQDGQRIKVLELALVSEPAYPERSHEESIRANWA